MFRFKVLLHYAIFVAICFVMLEIVAGCKLHRLGVLLQHHLQLLLVPRAPRNESRWRGCTLCCQLLQSVAKCRGAIQVTGKITQCKLMLHNYLKKNVTRATY